jgi:plastocyanin
MRAVLLRLAVGMGAAAAMACGGGYSSPAPTSPSPSPSGDPNAVTISIVRENGAQSFNPNPASVGGQVVVFKNNDSIVHRVVLNDGSIDTGDIAPGATSRAITMPGGGTNYHCSIHPSMIGSVSPSTGGEPPACQGPYC